MTVKCLKPLGRKAYGHIPHLSTSRMHGPDDHRCEPGQERIATVKTRDERDHVWVSEKLDGSNVAVAKLENGEIVPLIRAGYRAYDSHYEQHRLFADWVFSEWARFNALLKPGERVCGEWLAQAHGTIYRLRHEPFVVFDMMIEDRRLPCIDMRIRVQDLNFYTPRTIYHGPQAAPVEMIRRALEPSPHGAIDPVEGAVWRVERDGQFDFMVKWVRPDKVDGKYLPGITGKPAVWNWRPGNGL